MGNLLIIVYVLLSASKAVYLSHLLQALDPIVALFCTFFVTWLIFVVIALIQHRTKHLIHFSKQHFRSLLLFNFFTATSWVTFFVAVKLLEPSTHAVIANTSQPLLAFLFPATVVLSMSHPTKVLYRIGLFLIAVGIALQITIILLGYSALPTTSMSTMLLGLLMSILCSISLALNRNINYRLQQSGLTASDLMCVRFPGLLLATFVACYHKLSFDPSLLTMLQNHVWQVGLVSILGVAIPVYCLQKGQTLTDEFSAALWISFMPLLMLAMQMVDARFTFSGGSIFATVLATTGSLAVLMAKYTKAKETAL